TNVTLLPCPLYSSEQTEYYSYMNTKGSTYLISKNACGGDKNMISDFWSLYTFHSAKIVRPAFIATFGGLYCNAAQSVEMLELIMNGRMYDYAYYSSQFWGTLAGDITGASHANNLAKMASKKAKESQGYLDTYLENATKYGND
ncbi:MAG: hypothetical protein MJ101_06790, partial [Clostridia bacterium]|nr:hypothetical protein [Clostridia bacterium]